MAKKTLSYSSALAELQEIMEKIDNNDVDIDDLSKLVKRANELTQFCEAKLKKVEQELENTINEKD
ncbi:MAG: exodeoxyribonuclease VII small subunit [Cyclobacteriaceae bacterium]